MLILWSNGKRTALDHAQAEDHPLLPLKRWGQYFNIARRVVARFGRRQVSVYIGTVGPAFETDVRRGRRPKPDIFLAPPTGLVVAAFKTAPGIIGNFIAPELGFR